MNKLKHIPLLILVAALILAGAFLPRMVATAGDRNTLWNEGYEHMRAVEFELHRNIPSLGKLAMMEHMGSAVEILPNKASMTEQEAADACHTALQPYIEAGLMEDYRSWQIGVQAYLVQTGTVNGIFWKVSILNDGEAQYAIEAAIDDETGKLLCIRVSDQKFRGSELRTEYLYSLADLFFSGLHIQDFGAFATDDLEEWEYDRQTAIRYRFGDQVYGEVEVDICVHEYGFYVEFPGDEVELYEQDQ